MTMLLLSTTVVMHHTQSIIAIHISFDSHKSQPQEHDRKERPTFTHVGQQENSTEQDALQP